MCQESEILGKSGKRGVRQVKFLEKVERMCQESEFFFLEKWKKCVRKMKF